MYDLWLTGSYFKVEEDDLYSFQYMHVQFDSLSDYALSLNAAVITTAMQ